MHQRETQTDEQLPCQSLPRMGNKRRQGAGVGPGLWVTHRRPGRYIAAMAPGLALRDGHRNQCSRGDKEGGEGGSVAKPEGAEVGREALKKEAGSRWGGT